MAQEEYTSLLSDKVIHERSRLLIISYLARSDERRASFPEIRDALDMTAGNLSIQLKTLQKAGYIKITKEFRDNKPYTEARLTTQGGMALDTYLQEMEQILKGLKQ
jgi:DNA-binding MarR family transcriptional regulator